ncbi:SPOR domain-containing protein [Pseudodesulfovibrio sediminis]|uniref:SPOR domain-containing protein n=1 Tax=Pseudodesulfovibrio sediminis TaxID=2810563 RepID=A0ABN6EVW5_9BACT|nr:tetratricopeptide repeat protein [Pseudodesulfovibrio sediminis]BCS89627.1 hypothetical protein PSDVSF_28690 [Pseudodesulfovibrio sediminis]
MYTRITTTMILIVGLAMIGCVPKSNDMTFNELAYGNGSTIDFTSAQHEQVGDGYMRRGQPEMAIMHYNKAIEKDEKNLDVRVKRGNLLISQHLDEQALAEFNKVLQINPDHAIANESIGGVYFRAGLFDEAEIYLTKAVKLNPMLWKAHNYLGILFDRQGKYALASEHFSTALELHQGNGTDEINNNLGVVHLAQKQYAQAVECFRRALKAGGVSARTYNNLGLALARMGRLDEALESFKYAGGEAKANNNLGYVLLSDNQPAKAVPYFEKALELSPSYYVKAADNLKRARLAARFQANSDQELSGSTPNPLLRKSFPDTKQIPGEPAASPASAGSPSPSATVQNVALVVPGAGVPNISEKSYGLHVSSLRDHKDAFDYCAVLRKQGFDTWINQVDLGTKGIWYRVLVGKFSTIKEAKAERPDVLDILNLGQAPVFERVNPKVEGTYM